MKLPSELSPVITREYGVGGAPVYTVTLTFNNEEHAYYCYDLSDSAGLNIILKAMADGYDIAWDDVELTEEPNE